MKFLVRKILVCSTLTAAFSAHGAECAFRGTDNTARVVRNSGEMITPLDWTTDPRCETLSVVSGTVNSVYRDSDAHVIRRSLNNGRLAPAKAATNDSFMHLVSVMLSGDERVKAGRSRGAAFSFATIAEALPTGLVVQPHDSLTLAVPVAADESPGSFRLTRDGHEVFQARLPGMAIIIPARLLTPGQKYAWQINLGPDRATGGFEVVSEETFAAALAEAQTDDVAANDGPLERDMKTASALLQKGYAMEARARTRKAMLATPDSSLGHVLSTIR